MLANFLLICRWQFVHITDQRNKKEYAVGTLLLQKIILLMLAMPGLLSQRSVVVSFPLHVWFVLSLSLLTSWQRLYTSQVKRYNGSCQRSLKRSLAKRYVPIASSSTPRCQKSSLLVSLHNCSPAGYREMYFNSQRESALRCGPADDKVLFSIVGLSVKMQH